MIGKDKEVKWLVRDKYHGHKPSDKILSKDITRLKQGEPTDYVIGWKEFLGCKVDLSYKPLIPREETEFWVEEVIKSLRGRASQLRALDLFAGSGCIGLAFLKHCPGAEVTFADKEEKSIKQIKKNLRLNELKAKVVWSDVLSSLKKFDIIFANPPYIPTKKSKVQRSVKDWEPKLALYSGPDGLVIIRKFLKEAQRHLNPNSVIYLEFGFGQKKAIEGLLKQNNYKNWQFHKDQFGKYRWAKINF